MSGPTVYLADGTSTLGVGRANKVTSGSLSRFIKTVNWGDVSNTLFGHPSPTGAGFVRTGSAIADTRTVTMTIISEWASTNAERNLLDEANDDLPGLFAPGRGAWDLRADRTDSGGSATSRILTVDTVSIPDVYDASRILYRDNTAWIEWDVTMQASFPLWRDREVVTVDTVTTTGGADAWGAYSNGGMEACGLKATLSDIAGTVTSFVIACTEFGTSATWTDTAFANSDTLDFFVTDPQAVSWTSGNAITAASEIGLARGSNSGTVTRTGGTAATVTLTARRYWKGF